MRYLISSLVLCLFLSNVISAGTIDPSVPDSKYIEYGKKHECVVPIRGEVNVETNDGSTYFFKGSAVVVKPRVIITAAHVVKNTKNAYITVNNKKIPVLFTVYVASFNKEDFGHFDIAVGYLMEDAEVNFYPELYSKSDEVNKVCSIAGYGTTGTHKTGAIKTDGLKRAGSNVVEEVWNGMLVCGLKKTPHTTLEFLISHGDSGGGLFIDAKLAGINSCIMTDNKGNLNSDYNDQSCHTRISRHKEWLDMIIKELERLDAKNGKEFESKLSELF